MLRVICINENWVSPPGEEPNSKPLFLTEHDVIDTRFIQWGFVIDGLMVMPGTYYKLAGYGNDLFHADNFAILPGADAEQINQESKEAIINIENPLYEPTRTL